MYDVITDFVFVSESETRLIEMLHNFSLIYGESRVVTLVKRFVTNCYLLTIKNNINYVLKGLLCITR